MLEVNHQYIDYNENVAIDPFPQHAAVYTWCCICDLFIWASYYYCDDEFENFTGIGSWEERVRDLHYAMATLEGTDSEYNFGIRNCDACDIADAIEALFMYKFIDPNDNFYRCGFDESEKSISKKLSHDLVADFQIPMQRPSFYLAAKVSPKDRQSLTRSFEKALRVVAWLRDIKDGISSTAIATLESEQSEGIEDFGAIPTEIEKSLETTSGSATAIANNDVVQVARQSVVVDRTQATASIEKNAFKFEANPEVHLHTDMAEVLRIIPISTETIRYPFEPAKRLYTLRVLYYIHPSS